MTVLQEIESKAFTLPMLEKGQLIHDLIANIDQHPEYSWRFRGGDQKKSRADKIRPSRRHQRGGGLLQN